MSKNPESQVYGYFTDTVIEIINPMKGNVSIHGNSASTTKKDRKAHGYGNEIMKQITQRYNGNCEGG